MDIKILGSRCAISDEYYEAVESIVKKMGLDHSIQKIEDEDLMKAYDVTINCMYGYCPGCKYNNEGSNKKHTPALVVDGELKIHSEFPFDDVFEEVFASRY
ncbi:thioredoxin family protein [Alkalibacter mobilis]|uniref:thioredoxin family protein n=1 Tax=Alkalibacter mobilis TaxID=2787712 RepID=UPI0018A03B85|nr:thioredoxin family protein [Alkalibacter mobilis]MBF7097369.1 thioredoxin family protein [Alkalibacter mobilis]